MSDDGTAHVPLGEGLRVVSLRVRDEDVVLVRGILAGYDGVASAHGDASGMLAIVATDSTYDELEAILAGLPAGIVLSRTG